MSFPETTYAAEQLAAAYRAHGHPEILEALRSVGGRRRLPEAARMHHRMQTLVDVLFIESNPIPVKHALNCVGLRVGEPRLPLIPPSEGAAAFIEAELQRHSIDIKGAIAEAATA